MRQQLARDFHQRPPTMSDQDLRDKVLQSAYVSVTPTMSSLYRMIRFMESCPYATAFSSLISQARQSLYQEAHVTIMYSKSVGVPADKCPVKTSGLTNYAYTKPFTSYVRGFEFWGGHDNDGYLVAVLESPGLKQLHEKWKELGLKHSFDEYVPHMTIMTPYVDNTIVRNSLNAQLEVRPLELEFVNERLEPCKQNI